jgi:nitroimidazol reductase NimA-like FMN-containing flavoprotein (pyridoxamine 5'-phosphate oxidase superfamily)
MSDTGFELGRSGSVDHPVEQLGADECWELLAGARFGRLAVAAAGDLDIYPVNFVVDGSDLVFRTAEGTKLVEVMVSGSVTLEADHRDVTTGVAWSVVVKGHAELLDRFDDIYGAERLGIRPWVLTPKDRFVRIHVRHLSGRRFRRPAAF